MSFCFDECAISEVGMLDMFNECIVGPHSEAFLIMARGLVSKCRGYMFPASPHGPGVPASGAKNRATNYFFSTKLRYRGR